MDDGYKVGRLKWRVTIGRRIQSPSADLGILESLVSPVEVWADVYDVGELTFWNGQQVDTPMTHKIVMRWIGYIDNTWCVVRVSQPSAAALIPGTELGYPSAPRVELFRVRRVAEIGGRKRYTILGVELEKTPE